MKKIAITGGIASGKTTVCRILKKHGAYQLSSDDIIHQLIFEDQAVIDQIVNLLGKEILVDGEIDRKKVAKIVFTDREKLKALEGILHPKLLDRVWKEYERVSKESSYPFFVVEIPLIQEIGRPKEFDHVIAVVCDKKKAIARSPFSEREYEERMNNQWPDEKKAQNADYVIVNNGTEEELVKLVLGLVETLTKQENSSE